MSRNRSIAAILLAHEDASLVSRTIAALHGVDVLLHCDVKTPDDLLRAMVPAGADHVKLLPRVSTGRFGWSLVLTEIAGLQVALANPQTEYVIVMSGACYPIVSYERLADTLAGWDGATHCRAGRLPGPEWNHRWFADGGMWRLRGKFLVHDDNLVTVRDIPIPIGRHNLPAGVLPYGGSQWKIYARRHAQAVVDILTRDAAQTKYWSKTYGPDESCVQSLLNSPAMVGDLTESVVNSAPWWINWPTEGSSSHPSWLGSDDFADLKTARDDSGALFARKFRSADPEILDRIDAELHVT